MTRLTLLLFAALVSLSAASVLQEALEDHLKDIEHKEGQESIKHDKHKGEKLHEIDTQLTDKHQNQFSKSNDEGKWVKQDHDTKSETSADAYKGHNIKADKAEDSETTGYKRGHKKGHHNQGFQNSYHKDESSNKSTFFDDLNDEGDQAKYNSRLNSHDNHGGRTYHGGHNNGQEYTRNNYHGGGHNRHGDLGNKHHGYQNHGRKYYLDDIQNHNKYRNDHNTRNRDHLRDYRQYQAPHNQWDDRRWDDRRWEDNGDWDDRRNNWDDRRNNWDDRRFDDRNWEQPGQRGWKDYSGPGFYDDHGLRHEGGYGYGPNHGYGYETRADPVAQPPNPPVVADHRQANAPLATHRQSNSPVVARRQQTITIYEDPRYDGKDTGQFRKEQGDYLQLELKPSHQRYAQYDDTYYAPSRDGVESSKVNRLVYNYKRQ